MVFSAYLPSTSSVVLLSPNIKAAGQSVNARKNHWNLFSNKRAKCVGISNSLSSSSSHNRALQNIVPLAASVAILLWTNPAKAGILSGSTGIESIPGPQLPKIEFLDRFNDENQKKYAEFDERWKQSPLLKKYLEKSEMNKEKNKKEIQDKYCIRGAEWGVGDCSAEGMSPTERENFIAMLKEKAGMKD